MRRRLLVSYLLLVSVVLLVLEVPLGVLYVRHERAALTSEATRTATALAGVAQERLEGHDEMSDAAFDRLIKAYGDQAQSELVVYNAHGEPVVSRSGHERDDTDDSRPPGVTTALRGRSVTGTLTDDDRSWTYAVVPVTSGSRILGAVQIELSNEDTDERVEAVWLLLVGLAVGVLAVTGVVGWRMARWVNEPLVVLTDTAADVGAGRLDVRVPVDSGPPELRALAVQFNDMVGRIEGLVGAQKRFVADASHQLRTPLTALRLRIENLETSDAESASVEAALDEADRLGRLLDGLLAISRAEGVRAQPERLDVSAAVVDRCEAWGAFGDEQSVALSPVVPPGDPVEAMVIPGQLEQILDNLMANALDVSPPGSELSVVVSAAPGGVTVDVVDHGPGMTADQQAHAFDRFWQGGDGTQGRAGLGLAIVGQLVSANQGSIALSDTPGGGLTASIRLPAATSR